MTLSTVGGTELSLKRRTNISSVQHSKRNVMYGLCMRPQMSFPLGSVGAECTDEARFLAAFVLLVVCQSRLVLVHATTVKALENRIAICV